MKSLAKTIIAIILLCVYSPSFGQAPESDQVTYKAYLEGKDVAQSKALWKDAVKQRKIDFEANPQNENARYRLALAQFGLLTVTMRDEDEDQDECQKMTALLRKELIDLAQTLDQQAAHVVTEQSHDLDLEHLITFILSLFRFSGEFKQRLLEKSSTLKRAQLLLSHLSHLFPRYSH